MTTYAIRRERDDSLIVFCSYLDRGMLRELHSRGVACYIEPTDVSDPWNVSGKGPEEANHKQALQIAMEVGDLDPKFNKIRAIKRYRELTGLDLAASKLAIEKCLATTDVVYDDVVESDGEVRRYRSRVPRPA